MKIDFLIKNIATKFGVDIRAFTPERSEGARLLKLFAHYGIDLVLDVGANCGQYAAYLRSIGYKGKIVCFEPLSSAYSDLRKLAEKDGNILLAPRMAMGDRDGEVALNVAANSESSSILQILDSHLQSEPGAKFVGIETVRLARLDMVAQDYIVNTRGVFLKIDTQGYDSLVLQGATGIMPNIKGVQIELSLIPLYQGEQLYREMIDTIEALEFTLHDLNPCFSDKITGRTYQMDGIFFWC